MIEIARVPGLATVQDAGRPGWMHAGVPRGGAMIPERLARANAAAKNRAGAAAIEAFGPIALVARAACLVGSCDGTARPLAPGERLELEAPRERRARYLAIRGGIDVPIVLGGRGTLLVAGIGGLEGRALRKGDILGAGSESESESESASESESESAIRIVAGPDLDAFASTALDALLGTSFVISAASDRVGTRLAGPRIARVGADAIESRPMVRGAIEVTASGEAIVMGPDHPTTGGYPILGVVIDRDFGRIMGTPIGASIRFRAAAR